MISLEDCVALCGLSRDEIAAIAEHEHVPEIAAANLARYLLDCPKGPEEILHMIVDDIRAALRANRTQHAAELFSAFRHFVQCHPDGASLAAAKSHPVARDQGR